MLRRGAQEGGGLIEGLMVKEGEAEYNVGMIGKVLRAKEPQRRQPYSAGPF